MGAYLGHILVAYLGTIRPNAAEYSVSADTKFSCIGRSLFKIDSLEQIVLQNR